MNYIHFYIYNIMFNIYHIMSLHVINTCFKEESVNFFKTHQSQIF